MTPTDKIALVTGASRGLGAAMAEQLATRGYHVLALARTSGALEELDDRIKAAGGSATLAPMDITNDNAMQHLCRSAHERWGGIDLWVHAAVHAAPLSPATSIDQKDWDKSTSINLDATRRLIVYVAPLLQARTDSKALFFDDTGIAGKFFGSYGATKAAQIALARYWQAESEKHGPKVHIAQPAPMPTATRARFYPGEERDSLVHPMDEAKRICAEILDQD
ncbi:SDR family NAD(P)-dependent oxidoreductase [Qingshengfaniella alkalisoli]|uniref:SDR family oxidoreductase n=1 Tax=Qingshengfaniella alkalisoli TaxID=2599296 RepID=A0A5B8IT25_9RHOB|nr:SDR family oxidoreductase [Qingshengfaniella alkalisoli]QDY68774.1 SDR family oxidoreductase [Qingshengfaniella alkalisoli]